MSAKEAYCRLWESVDGAEEWHHNSSRGHRSYRARPGREDEWHASG